MKSIFSFKYKNIKRNISILTNEIQVGYLSLSEFSLISHAELFENSYFFNRKSHFSSTTNVNMYKGQEPIATIRNNTLSMGAQIRIDNNFYQFKYKNLLCQEWYISDEHGNIVINYLKTDRARKAVLDDDQQLLFLCGLYLSGNNYVESSSITWTLFFVVLYCTIF